MVRYLVLIILLCFSIYSDLKYSRIRNIFVVFSILAAFIINIEAYGISGAVYTVRGIVLPIALLGIFFHAGLLGAGDIKLFSSIGALLGWHFVLYTMMYTFLAAGAICFIVLLKKSKLKSSFANFYQDAKISLFSNSLRYFQVNKDRRTFKLSPVVALGSVFQIVILNFFSR